MTEATHKNPDADLIAMIDRADQLWTEWDRVAKENEDDPRIDSFSEEVIDLEVKILVTPAFTSDGLAGKRRVVERAELSHWDDLDLINTIFALDAERVAAAR